MGNAGLERLAYLKFLLSVEGIGPQKIFSILSRYGNYESFSESSAAGLMHLDGISVTLAGKLLHAKHTYRNFIETTENEAEKLRRINAEVITFWDEEYPELLKQIYYPPIMIYRKGSYIKQDKSSVAVVGTRNPTNYGRITAEKFASDLARNNICVVSGLARGIDSIAHESSLKSGGRTIAVIGSGLDIIYPPENKKLFERIAENGAVFSEYEPGTKPDAQNFPRRNRIISGLSLGTLVIETRINGGALQTAEYALDQSREIFAVPGNLNSPQSEGPNMLIQRSSAKLVTKCEDILQELRLTIEPPLPSENIAVNVEFNLFEEKIYSVLSGDQTHIDEIAARTGLGTGEVLSNLLSLEFKGVIRQFPGKMFSRI